MKTKIVYCLVSREKDNYLEQAYISVLSLKEHTIDVKACLIVDEETAQTESEFRKRMISSFDELVTVKIDKSYTNVEKSRYLKTTARLYVDGPCLFVDTDTIFADDISDLDSLLSKDIDIAAVLDSHGLFKDMARKEMQIKRSMKVGWGDIVNDKVHYNSGVIFTKDSSRARSFYKQWNNNWEYERQFGLHFDQIALAKTCRNNNYPIIEMDGIWNCQIFTDGIRYLSHAKIIHYFGGAAKTSPYLFKNKEVYAEIKNEEKVPEHLFSYIKDGRSAFVGHCTLCGNSEQKYYWSDMRQFSMKHSRIFSFLEAIVTPYIELRRYLHKRRIK